MSHHLLFQHHPGRLPGPARWYLAFMAMLSLILLAAHFAVQTQIQKTMREAADAWLHPIGGSAAQVRYRLLRGSLTLTDVQLSQGRLKLNIPSVYLHAATSAIFSKNVRFSQLRIDGMELVLTRTDVSQWLQGVSPASLLSLLSFTRHARRLSVVNGQIRFADGAAARAITQLSGQLTPAAFDLSGQVGGGSFALHGVADNAVSNGTLSWEGMAAAELSHALGLAVAPPGTSSAFFNWRADWPAHHLDVYGNVQLLDQPEQGTVRIQGKVSPGKLDLRAGCSGVSLTGLGSALPPLEGRYLQAGIWDGDIHLARDRHGRWTVHLNGEAHKIRLVSETLPDWRIDRLTISDATAMLSAHRMDISQANIVGMDLVLLSAGSKRDISPWKIQVSKLRFDDVRPVINLGEGKGQLSLPSLRGDGGLVRSGILKLDLASSGDEPWRIHWEAHPGGLFTADIEAENVPVIRLRPLLPHLSLPGNRGEPRLSGTSSFQLSMQSGNGKTWFGGQSSFSSVVLAQGGDSFSADRIKVNIHKAGMVRMQELGQVQIEGWRYQAALHPIPQAVGGNDGQEDLPRQRKLPWHVESITGHSGVIAVGSENAVWARDASFSLKKLHPGGWAPLTLDATLGGGSLHMRGKADLFSASPRWKCTMHLKHALPFFLNDWMAVSGAPRLIRGRLYMTFYIRPDPKKASYTGRLNLELREGLLEPGVFPHDPLLPLIGYNMQDMFGRLSRGYRLTLAIPFHGEWRKSPFSMRVLGVVALAAAKRQGGTAAMKQSDSAPAAVTVSHVRLQRRRSFSYNERLRLWHVIKALRKQPRLIAELVPQLGHTPLDSTLTGRVRRTQDMIEQYMRKRGIAGSRIFPVWPGVEHHRGDVTGIKIMVRPR